MKQFTLNVAPRTGVGRGPSRRVRQSGRVPAIVYGTIREPQSVSVDGPEFTRLLKGIAGSAAIIELKEPGAGERLSIIQEIQRDALTDQVLHIDLHEVSAAEEMEIEVTVHSSGDCVGVRVENGILETVSHRVRVRCLPKDLPAFIEVDVSNLHVNHSLHLRELPELAGVKYIGNPDQPIFAVVEPVVEVEVTPAAATLADGAAAAAESAAAPAAGGDGKAAPAAGDAKAAGAKAGDAKGGAKPGDAKAGAKPAAAAGKAPAKK